MKTVQHFEYNEAKKKGIHYKIYKTKKSPFQGLIANPTLAFPSPFCFIILRSLCLSFIGPVLLLGHLAWFIFSQHQALCHGKGAENPQPRNLLSGDLDLEVNANLASCAAAHLGLFYSFRHPGFFLRLLAWDLILHEKLKILQKEWGFPLGVPAVCHGVYTGLS